MIINEYFTGKLGEFYFTKNSQDQSCLQNIQSTSSFEMKMREFFLIKTSQSGSFFYLSVPRDEK